MICVGLFVMWCHANGVPVDASSFCQIAKPILWSAADTRLTKEAADTHNRIGKKLCGWGSK